MRKSLIKVEDTTEVVVGNYYLVAHVHVINKDVSAKVDIDVPIIPILHNDDKTFGVSVGDHYHLDGRFIANNGRVGKIWNCRDGRSHLIISSKHGNQVSSIFYKRKRCLFLNSGVYLPSDFPQINEWKNSMRGKSCKGGRCPHYGTKMNLVDGKYICPMHRLEGCPKTEVIL